VTLRDGDRRPRTRSTNPPVASTAATTAQLAPAMSPCCRRNEKGRPLERGTPAGAAHWLDEATVEPGSDVRSRAHTTDEERAQAGPRTTAHAVTAPGEQPCRPSSGGGARGLVGDREDSRHRGRPRRRGPCRQGGEDDPLDGPQEVEAATGELDLGLGGGERRGSEERGQSPSRQGGGEEGAISTDESQGGGGETRKTNIFWRQRTTLLWCGKGEGDKRRGKDEGGRGRGGALATAAAADGDGGNDPGAMARGSSGGAAGASSHPREESDTSVRYVSNMCTVRLQLDLSCNLVG
jgi:hypothetical protein